jgi:hypothetical protein
MTRCLLAGHQKHCGLEGCRSVTREDNAQKGIIHTQFVVIVSTAGLPDS